MRKPVAKILGAALVATLGLVGTANANLIFDVRAVSATGTTIVNNTKSVTVGGANDVITFDVYVVITTPGATPGYLNSQGVLAVTNAVGTGITKGVMSPNGAVMSAGGTGVGIAPFNGTAAQLGKLQDVFGNGNTDIGALGYTPLGVSGTTRNSVDFLDMNSDAMVTTGWTTQGDGSVSQKLGSFKYAISTPGLVATTINFIPRGSSLGVPTVTSATWNDSTGTGVTPSPTDNFSGGADVVLGGGNIPEPASLGVLALGGVALMARRRRKA